MVRKEKCPRCGSGKTILENGSKKCKVCGFDWSEKIKRKSTKQDKVRF